MLRVTHSHDLFFLAWATIQDVTTQSTLVVHATLCDCKADAATASDSRRLFTSFGQGSGWQEKRVNNV